MTREERLARLARGVDVLVVGGGATGAGIAWDAASRGLTVGVLEARDFGAGTSSRSTKLIHGGVRYLAQGRLGLVREALAERELLARQAPALVKPLAFAVPVMAWTEALKFRAGLAAYDLLAGRDRFPPSAWCSATALAQAVPGLRRGVFRGGVRYYDGQFDDTALLFAVLRAASAQGALCVNYAPLTRLLLRAGRVGGGVCIDEETGREHEVPARCVVNATGANAAAVQALDPRARAVPLQLSRGSHLVVPARFLGGDTAILMPRVDDGRVMFAIPWRGHTLLGTTDLATAAFEAEPMPGAAEIDAILATAARYLEPAPTRAEVTAMFCGLRPLAGTGGEATARVSREHVLVRSDSGLVTITGGKWTTFRRMAEETIDFALAGSGLAAGSSRTAQQTLMPVAAPDVDTPLPGLAFGEEACRRAVRLDYARRTEDILARRCRALFTDVDAARVAAPRVAAIVGAELGRDAAAVAADLAAFTTLAARYSLRG